MRLDQAVSTFLTVKQEVLAESTHKQYRNTLHDFAAFVGYSRPIAEITSADIEKWRDHHSKSKSKKPQSVNQYMNRVRALFEYAVKRGWVTSSPVMLVDSLRVEAPERKRYDANTLGRALDAAKNPRDRAAIAVALELLLRGNEIVRLKVRDLDLDNRIMKVKVSKKNGPDSWDEMAITEELANELRQWVGTYRSIAGELDPDWYLFPRIHQSLVGGAHELRTLPDQSMGSPWRVVKRALMVVGVAEKGLGFHTIRRSAARILFDHMSEQQGDSRALSHVSSLLHHENRRTTEQYLGAEGDRRNRNLAVRQGTPSALTLTLAELDELPDAPSSGVVVDLHDWRSA